MKVLILEPSKFWKKVLCEQLTNLNYNIELCDSGETVLADADNQSYDFIMASLHLEDMTGIEFAEKYCQKILNPPPIVLLTSNDDDKTVAEAISVGVTEVFFKSNIDQLSEWISTFSHTKSNTADVSGNVLLVEDSTSVATFTKNSLENIGITVTVFDNAEAAWEAFQKYSFVLVVVDLVLAGKMTGLGLTRLIRKVSDVSKARVPILAFSSLQDQRRTVELLSAGANDFLPKPFIAEELLARATNLIANFKLLKKIEEQGKHLQRLALTDQLTGVYNRHYLVESAPKMIKQAVRHGNALSLAVIDLDHFKKINDTHGHQAGDTVLVEVAELLRQEVREEDIVARFGGEEFVIVLSHCDGQRAQEKLNVLREKISNLNPANITVTASIGITTLPEQTPADFSGLFHFADEAVYEAKSSGRNTVTFKPFQSKS